MEFRSCPACKASVLEDDLQECPFCGASMSGKPSSAPLKKPAAAKPGDRPAAKSNPSTPAVGAKAGAAGKSSERPTPRPASTPAKAEGDKDDPFEVDTSAMRRAVKLAPRPTKVRTTEVKCPMCETLGYMAPTDAGKDVHCSNPECMVPVFKTQRVKVEAPVEEKAGFSPAVTYGGGLGAVALVAALVWFFVLAPQPVEEVVEQETATVVTPIRDLGLVPDNKVVERVDATPATLAEIRTNALIQLVEYARQKDRNRSPDFGTQLAAEAFANAGNLAKAQEQLQRLQNTAARAPHLQVQPLVEIGWYQLATGKLKEAQATAAQAFTKAKNSPKSVRKTLDAWTSLAALLVATDNSSQAQEIVQQEQNRSDRGELSAFWRASVDCQTFQIDLEARRPWHVAMPEPMRIAIVESLVAQSQFDKALDFAGLGEDVASQAVCRGAWAGRVAHLHSDEAQSRVTAAASKLENAPASQCAMWSGVASIAQAKGNAELVRTSLENAQAALAKLKAPGLVAILGMKEIHDSEGKANVGLPNPAPAHAAAMANLSLAVTLLEAGQKEAAWTHFQQAVDQLRGMTPSPVVTQQLLDECEQSEASVRDQLNKVLRLNNNEQQLRTAFSRYRRQCGRLHAMAEQRLALQETVLRFALRQGLVEEVWSFVKGRIQEPAVEQRDPYLQTSLPGFIKSLAQAQGNAELVSSVDAAAGSTDITVDPLDTLYAGTAAALSKFNPEAASELIKAAYRGKIVGKQQPDRLDLIALQSSARASAFSTPEAMIGFVNNLLDVVIQEEAFYQLAGYSVQTEKGPQLWKAVVSLRSLEALEYASIFRGLIAGLPRTVIKPVPAKVTPVESK